MIDSIAKNSPPSQPWGNLPAKAVIQALEPLLTTPRKTRMRQVLASRCNDVCFVFEAISKPHNVSAALRSLDAFSFQEVHLLGGMPAGMDSLDDDVVDRTSAQPSSQDDDLCEGISMGSQRWLSLHTHSSIDALLSPLRHRNFKIAASHIEPTDDSMPLSFLDFSQPMALLFGNEKKGISEALLNEADYRFHIPMDGFVTSLNLSVAVAITAYHVRNVIRETRKHIAQTTSLNSWQEGIYANWLYQSFALADKVLASHQPD